MKKYIVFLFALLLSVCAFSQKDWKAELSDVPESGYYNIHLAPKLVAGSNSVFSNLRIVNVLNGDSTEVPYFLRPATPIEEVSSFEAYNLRENRVKDSLNIVVVDNIKKETLERFYLVISKADVQIELSIRGSNDLKQWYIVKQKSAVSNNRNSSQNDAVLIADFPQGNYKYYEVILENNQKSPLEIKQVGKMSSSSIYGQFEEIDLGKHLQVEGKNNTTFITFPNNNDAYLIGKMEFLLKTQTMYLRNAALTDSLKYGKTYFELSSKGDGTYLFNNYMLQGSTTIEIDNKSNPPLTVDAIRAYALKRYLCAYLEKGKSYIVEIDGEKSDVLNYDICHFANEIPSDLPILETKNVASFNKVLPIREQMFIEKPVVLWSIIFSLGAFLTFICVKMVKRMKDEEK